MMIDETALKEGWNKEVIRGRAANGQLPFFEVWEEIGSTNDRAAVLAKGGAPDFCLVTADKQTAGKGRRGRVWESPAGSSLSMSLILRPRVPLDTLSQLTILGGIAVKRCLEKAGTAPRIKWPNDIRLMDRKVCGILAETALSGNCAAYTILGIGINIRRAAYAEDVAPLAISLEEAGAAVSREELMAKISGEMMDLTAKWEQAGDLSFIRDEYEASMEWKGEICRVISADGSFTEGRVLGINTDGTLRFLTKEGESAVGAGEVSLRR